MATREVVISYRSAFDASGAAGALRANDAVGASVQRYGTNLKGSASSLVDFELKERRVEAVTKNVSAALFTAAQSGSAMQGGMRAGAAALDFLGNAAGSLAGPVGIAILLATNLAAAFLQVTANSKDAADQAAKMAEKQRDLNRAISETLELQADPEDLAHTIRLRAQLITADEKRIDFLRKITEGDMQVIQAELLALGLQKERTGSTAEITRKEEGLIGSYKRHVAGLREIDAADKLRGTTLEATEVSYRDLTRTILDGNVLALQSDADRFAKEKAARDKSIADERARVRALVLIHAAGSTQIASLAGNLAQLLETTGGASFNTIKGLRYAEAVINTAAGVVNAIGGSGIPYPYNLIAAASVAAAGAVQVATIAKTSPGGGGSITAPSASIGGGGGIPAAGGGGGGGPGPFTIGGMGGGGGGVGALAGATVTVTIEQVVFQALDWSTMSDAAKLRLGAELARILSFQMNGLGNRFGR